MSDRQRPIRTVPAAKVREWLAWFGEQSTQDPRNTENRRLSNRLYTVCQRAGAPDSTLAARGTPAAKGESRTAFDWETGEIPFTVRPGFGPKTIDRLITRVVAVTGIRE